MPAVGWEPLADRDPVPGDPYALADLARHYLEHAGTMQSVIDGLRRVDAGDQESEAVRVLAERRDDLIPRLEALRHRYETAATTLRGYCPALEEAQRMAAQALRMAQDAQADAQRACRYRDEAVAEVEAARAADPTAPLRPVHNDPSVSPWTAQIDDAEGRLSAAQRLLADATALRDEAANRAAEALEDAADDAIANDDSLWGDVTGGLSDAFDWVADRFDSLKDLSATLGTVSAALGILGLVFPPAGIAAAALGGVKLGIDTYLAATGQGGWGEVAFGAVSLMAFGMGRAATAAARGSAGAAASRNLDFLRNSVGRAGALRNYTAFAEDGRKIYGAAARSLGFARYPGAIQQFGTSSARGILPNARHWVSAATQWRNFELPGQAIVKLSNDAVRFRNIAWGTQGVGAILDADELGGGHLQRIARGGNDDPRTRSSN